MRQTGRTSRLLAEAVRLAAEERTVYVLTATAEHARHLWRKLNSTNPQHGIKCEIVPPNFDWSRMSVPGSHSNCVWLVDHYAIESRFGVILNMLHRFDAADITKEKEEEKEKRPLLQGMT